MAQVMGRRADRRQTTERRQARRSKMSKGWVFSKRLSVPEYAIRIHFQRPTKVYKDPWDPDVAFLWKKGAKHYIKKINNFVECAHAQCLTCAYQRPSDYKLDGVQTPKFLKDMWAKEYYSFSAFVEEWHYVIAEESDRVGDDGKPRMYYKRRLERDAKADMEEAGHKWSAVKGELSRVYGRQGFLAVSAPAWNNEFSAVYEQIERLTKDGGYLFPTHYACCACNAPVFGVTEECPSCGCWDVSIDSGHHRVSCDSCDHQWSLLESTDKDLRTMSESLHKCPGCNEQTYTTPKYAKLVDEEAQEADFEEPEGGWDTYDIFDVQLTLHTQKSTETSPPKVVIDEWEIKPLDKRLFDPQYQNERDDDEHIKKTVEYHNKPLDLDIIHRPDDPESQSNLLSLDNLFSPKTKPMARTAIRYGVSSAKTDSDGSDEED